MNNPAMNPNETASKTPQNNILTGLWQTECDVCKRKYWNGVGSTQCCGSIQTILHKWPDAPVQIAVELIYAEELLDATKSDAARLTSENERLTKEREEFKSVLHSLGNLTAQEIVQKHTSTKASNVTTSYKSACEELVIHLNALKEKASGLQAALALRTEERNAMEKWYGEAVRAVGWMHDDESIASQILEGENLTVKGVILLKSQRDTLRAELAEAKERTATHKAVLDETTEDCARLRDERDAASRRHVELGKFADKEIEQLRSAVSTQAALIAELVFIVDVARYASGTDGQTTEIFCICCGARASTRAQVVHDDCWMTKQFELAMSRVNQSAPTEPGN